MIAIQAWHLLLWTFGNKRCLQELDLHETHGSKPRMTIITPETVQLIHLVLQQWHFKTSVKVHTNFLHTNYKIQIQAEQLTQLKKKKKKGLHGRQNLPSPAVCIYWKICCWLYKKHTNKRKAKLKVKWSKNKTKNLHTFHARNATRFYTWLNRVMLKGNQMAPNKALTSLGISSLERHKTLPFNCFY